MKTRLFVPMLLALAFAGCARQQESAVTTDAPVDPQPPRTVQTRQLQKPIAKGVQLGFAHHLRSDRIREVKPGKYQRRVLIEYLGMDQQQAADAVIASLLNAGFEQTDMSRLDDGRLRIGFRKNKHRIRVLVKNGGELRHAEARGLIRFDIPTKVSEAAQR